MPASTKKKPIESILLSYCFCLHTVFCIRRLRIPRSHSVLRSLDTLNMLGAAQSASLAVGFLQSWPCVAWPRHTTIQGGCCRELHLIDALELVVPCLPYSGGPVTCNRGFRLGGYLLSETIRGRAPQKLLLVGIGDHAGGMHHHFGCLSSRRPVGGTWSRRIIVHLRSFTLRASVPVSASFSTDASSCNNHVRH
jgi:hypothetical protein